MNLTMHLIEILLPVSGPDGVEFPATKFERLARELTEKFGGVTSFTRSPAEGRWKTQGGTEHDDIVVMEVMAETLDRDWWKTLRIDCCASSTRRSWSSAPKRSRSCDFWRTSPLRAHICGRASGSKTLGSEPEQAEASPICPPFGTLG